MYVSHAFEYLSRRSSKMFTHRSPAWPAGGGFFRGLALPWALAKTFLHSPRSSKLFSQPRGLEAFSDDDVPFDIQQIT